MKEKAINGSIKKIVLISIFLIFLVGTVSALPDLYVSSASTNYKYSGEVYANENNSMVVTVCNAGLNVAYDVEVSLYVSDVGWVVTDEPVVDDLGSGDCASITLIDPTIRTSQGSTVTYKAQVNCSNVESNYDNNTLTTSDYEVLFNGYKGKRYWTGKSDITTKRTYDGNINMTYYNQTPATYVSTTWTERTETWPVGTPDVPAWATVEEATVYISYNWGNMGVSVPDFGVKFNDNTLYLTDPQVLNGNYTDNANIGSYGHKMYGLLSVNVTEYYNQNTANILNMTRNNNVMALYPSTLVVIYADGNETYKQIFINENADELAVTNISANYNYNVSAEEATEYVPFEDIESEEWSDATLYSFVASAGHPKDGGAGEGNLYFNNNPIATYAWEGTSYSAYPYIAYNLALNATGNYNVASIQGTSYTGMLNIEQILVLDSGYV